MLFSSLLYSSLLFSALGFFARPFVFSILLCLALLYSTLLCSCPTPFFTFLFPFVFLLRCALFSTLLCSTLFLFPVFICSLSCFFPNAWRRVLVLLWGSGGGNRRPSATVRNRRHPFATIALWPCLWGVTVGGPKRCVTSCHERGSS